VVIGTDPFRVLRVVCARMRLCKVRCTHASNVSPSVFVGVRVSLCLPAFTPMPRMHSAQLRLSGSFYCPRRSNGRKPCLVQVFLPLSLSLSRSPRVHGIPYSHACGAISLIHLLNVLSWPVVHAFFNTISFPTFTFLVQPATGGGGGGMKMGGGNGGGGGGDGDGSQEDDDKTPYLEILAKAVMRVWRNPFTATQSRHRKSHTNHHRSPQLSNPSDRNSKS
jgi:hypothetical protein